MTELIVLSGLPGVGKTSVATTVALGIGAVHLSIDAVEEAMLGCGLPTSWQVGVAAYETARAMAVLNLRNGHDVVIDAVNDSEEARQTWRTAAEAADARLAFVHLVVADAQLHEERLRGRDRGFAHVREPTWEDVEQRRAGYAPWTDEHLELDTAARSVDQTAREVIAQLASQ
ncbi:AAA family ATPase [Ruania zhangjianzhongii]|uniref:AAA family ATPase n=1 Tax=Ruania zhangjianzhongii TaxID=2603206 RepID=UPI0011C88D38|nr:AAA family ATPase [Ruania zhangjianzhongii]